MGATTTSWPQVKVALNRAISPPMRSLQSQLDATVERMNASPFGVPHTTNQPFNWASNADIANSGGMLAFAQKMLGPFSLYQQQARRVASYLLGHNPLGKSYVTGYGHNPPRNPHHRFWAKHADIGYPSAPPGMLVGGPNGSGRGQCSAPSSRMARGVGVGTKARISSCARSADL
ncbi:MAG: glycoside hydrolase family 9 protein [Uliginosibacterium sp.]|nr:glycoside hydrolase family 9 protein [Uliginosibacterium sp.]